VDRVRCEQILWNLVSNALKFTEANGQIDLRLSQEGGMLRIEVSDNGQGIDAALLPYVFDMYRQGGRDRAKGGLGIGLALVKQLARMHGGRVTAQSEGRGHGTTTTVWLPAAPADTASDPEAADSIQSIAGLRILLVEGDRDTSAALAELLELEGATVSVATSGAETLERLADVPIDAIVSDIGLPDMDGYALMRTIREDARWANIWSVALTGRDYKEDAKAAREAGYNMHLAKPLDFQELLEALGDLRPRQDSVRPD